MMLLIDNYDSFTYNLVHYLGELGADVQVHRNDALDVQAMLAYARDTGGPALRALTFHDRARMIKALAAHLGQHKQAL